MSETTMAPGEYGHIMFRKSMISRAVAPQHTCGGAWALGRMVVGCPRCDYTRNGMTTSARSDES